MHIRGLVMQFNGRKTTRKRHPESEQPSVSSEGAITTSITGPHGRRYRQQKMEARTASFNT